ncbi:hypothetical protein HDU99_007486, partial [Rhizoclosmatium hyalinum]
PEYSASKGHAATASGPQAAQVSELESQVSVLSDVRAQLRRLTIHDRVCLVVKSVLKEVSSKVELAVKRELEKAVAAIEDDARLVTLLADSSIESALTSRVADQVRSVSQLGLDLEL